MKGSSLDTEPINEVSPDHRLGDMDTEVLRDTTVVRPSVRRRKRNEVEN